MLVAAVRAENARHVRARFGIRRHAVIPVDRAGSGVVRRDGQRHVVVIAVQQRAKICRCRTARSAVGSNGLAIPQPDDVPGINCIRPCAPATLTADGSPADSAMTTARTSPSGTPFSCDAPETSESISRDRAHAENTANSRRPRSRRAMRQGRRFRAVDSCHRRLSSPPGVMPGCLFPFFCPVTSANHNRRSLEGA